MAYESAKKASDIQLEALCIAKAKFAMDNCDAVKAMNDLDGGQRLLPGPCTLEWDQGHSLKCLAPK